MHFERSFTTARSFREQLVARRAFVQDGNIEVLHGKECSLSKLLAGLWTISSDEVCRRHLAFALGLYFEQTWRQFDSRLEVIAPRSKLHVGYDAPQAHARLTPNRV